MRDGNQKKIVRLLGVGFDAEDGHVRITKGEKYDIFMGSEESHEYITGLINKIEDQLKATGMSLDDFTPEEFSEFMKTVK